MPVRLLELRAIEYVEEPERNWILKRSPNVIFLIRDKSGR
jgi:hypothetical protein